MSQLVNLDRLRKSIKLLFEGSLRESIGELLQNSQRAGATKVICILEPDKDPEKRVLTYIDNGHGLRSVGDFETLLTLGGSAFNTEVMLAQNPMGLGIHCLLAWEKVETVTIASNGLMIEIDPERWWTDQSYWSNWQSLLTQGPRVDGVQIFIRLKSGDGNRSFHYLDQTIKSTLVVEASGYYDIFTEGVWLNGKQIELSPIQLGRGQIKTTYCDNELIIRLQHLSPPGRINWYGQLISVNIGFGVEVYYHVRKGRPLNPMSPTRKGIVQDSKWDAFISFIKDALFEELNKGGETPSVAYISSLYRIDPERAAQCPYFLAEPIEGYKVNGLGVEEIPLQRAVKVCRYDDPPLLVEEEVVCICKGEGEEELTYGIHTVADSIPFPIFRVVNANVSRLTVHKVYWETRRLKDERIVKVLSSVAIPMEAGTIRLGDSVFKVESPIVVGNETSSYIYHWVEKPKIGFVKNPSSEIDSLEYLFEGSEENPDWDKYLLQDELAILSSRLRPNTLLSSFSKAELEKYLAEEFGASEAQVQSVTYVYREDGLWSGITVLYKHEGVSHTIQLDILKT